MDRYASIALLAGVMSLAACQQAAPPADPVHTEASQSTPVAATPLPPSPATPTSAAPSPHGANPTKPDPYAGTNDGYPDLTPTPTVPEQAKGETGARAILLSWARAVELREFDQAWDMMGPAAKAGIPKSAFNAIFAPLHTITVAVPGGTMEGAAGSLYYTAPTTVTGTQADGTKQTLTGEVVLRRVNDVDGATAEQLRWHIASVQLK